MDAKKTDLFHDTTVSVSFLDWDNIDNLNIRITILSTQILIRVYKVFIVLRFQR